MPTMIMTLVTLSHSNMLKEIGFTAVAKRVTSPKMACCRTRVTIDEHKCRVHVLPTQLQRPSCSEARWVL